MQARQTIYPSLFGVSPASLTFEDTLVEHGGRNAILDAEMAVDRIVNVSVQHLVGPLPFTVQERFRRPEYARYQDLTVTEWNHASGLPSELYKITSGLFLYGYFDATAKIFADAVCIIVPALLLSISTGRIQFERKRNRKEQTFLAFAFDDLHRSGVVYWRLAQPETLGVGLMIADNGQVTIRW